MRVLQPFLHLLAGVAAYTTLSDENLKNLPKPGNDFHIQDGALLAPILIPRVPGTENIRKVQQHFVDFLGKTLPNWRLEFQNSTSTTPTSNGKEIPFVNIIATRDPPWSQPGDVRRLALVAHYDSLQTPEDFIGAVDSAAPCAMLLHAVRSIDEALTKKWEAMEAEGAGAGLEEAYGIQLLLLDGEEAFLSWTDTDSLYGARALAEAWEQTSNQAMSIFQNPLDSIALFVLLDLLGSKHPNVPSYYKTTHWAYQAMASIEERMSSLDALHADHNPKFLPESDKKDTDRWLGGMIGDDHVPFLARGVDILHLIPSPFPDVWHNHRGIPDDAEHLDTDSVVDWAMIVTAFAAEWMDLDKYLGSDAGQHAADATMHIRDELYNT